MRMATMQQLTQRTLPQEVFDGEVDVRTERAVCGLLLGDMTGAEAALGLAAVSNGASGPDPNILAYVQVCSLLSCLVVSAQSEVVVQATWTEPLRRHLGHLDICRVGPEPAAAADLQF